MDFVTLFMGYVAFIAVMGLLLLITGLILGFIIYPISRIIRAL